MPLPLTSDARTALEQLLTVAQQHGRDRIAETCTLALRALDDLEAAIAFRHALSRHGGQVAMAKRTPDELAAFQRHASQVRWAKHRARMGKGP